MARRIPVNLPLEPRGSWWDAAIEVVLAALLAFMPLALGVVARWSEAIVLAVVTGICSLLLLRLVFARRQTFVWSWSYVFVVLFVGLACAQLLPLPTGWVKAVSPNTAATKAALLGDVPGVGPAPSHMQLSFCPAGTRHDLAIVLVDTAVFVVTINVYRRPEQIKRLLATVAAVGGAVVLIALAQDALEAKEIYWLIPMPTDVPRGGPFVNHNNFAQYANLIGGGALALLLVHLREVSREWGGVRVRDLAHLRGPEFRLVWVLLALLLGTFVAVALSASRGGIIATLVALAITTAVLGATRSSNAGRGALVGLIGLAAFGCVLYFGFDAVYERFTSKDIATYGGRKQIFAGIAGLFRAFPVVGMGLGTHQYVYPMTDTSGGGTLAAYVENEYAQMAEETGVLGLLLVAGFVATMLFHYVRNVRRSGLPVGAAAFGLGFGLVAVMAHSLSDFGQHFPSIGCVSAIFCGLLVVLTRLGRHGDGAGAREARPAARFAPSRLAGWAVTVALVVGLAWQLPRARAAWRAESHWDQATALESGLREKQWVGSEDEFARLITDASAAADLCPDDVRYRYGLNAYRWQSVAHFYEPHTAPYQEYAGRIVDELHRARALCPTYGPPYSLAGQLETFALDRPEGAGHIRTGYRLAPVDPVCCFAAGRLDAYQAHWDASLKAFGRAIRLDARLRPDVLDVYLGQVGRADLAAAVVQDDWAALTQLADRLESPSDPNERAAPDVAARARLRAASILQRESKEPDASAEVLGTAGDLAYREKDYTTAIDCYRRALSRNFNQVDWHLSLARSLAATGQLQPAHREAAIAVRLRPESDDAKALLKALETASGTGGEPE